MKVNFVELEFLGIDVSMQQIIPFIHYGVVVAAGVNAIFS
jgi:hypothetical protein